MDRPLFEVVTTSLGVLSIRNTVVNEIMHNPVGPWKEANALYVEQSGLAQKLLVGDGEYVVYDVGLGAAANALAVLHCAKSLIHSMRPLHLVSFELDLDLLRFALKNAHHFDHFTGYESCIEELLEKQNWTEGPIQWTLLPGDFQSSLSTPLPKPHLILYDPYSPKRNAEMWMIQCFTNLRRKCRESFEGCTELYTYSQATSIRAALIRAGFFVGQGQSTGLKESTTVASTSLTQLKNPLGLDWFQRYQKSHSKYPFDCGDDQKKEFDAFIGSYFDSFKLQLNSPS